MPDELIEDQPAVEAETPEPEPFVLPEDFASKVQSWGVPLEDLDAAVDTHKRLQTEDGVIDTFIATGQSLGFGIKELQQLFAEEDAQQRQPAPAAQPVEEQDPDAYLTRAEVDELIKSVRSEQQTIQEQIQQREFEATQRRTFDAITSWFDSQGITDEDVRQSIAQRGERHILPGQNSYDPRVAIAALERGKADYEAFLDREAKAYIAKKGLVAQSQPTPPGGGQTFSGDGGDDQTPNYAELGAGALKAAKERVRARLREAGELG